MMTRTSLVHASLVFAMSVLSLACADEPFDESEGTDVSTDDLESTLVTPTQAFRDGVDELIRTMGPASGDLCDTIDGRTVCAVDSRSPVSLVHIGDPHDPLDEPDYCTLTSTGAIDTCSPPVAEWQCFVSHCACEGLIDCADLWWSGKCAGVIYDYGGGHGNCKAK